MNYLRKRSKRKIRNLQSFVTKSCQLHNCQMSLKLLTSKCMMPKSIQTLWLPPTWPQFCQENPKLSIGKNLISLQKEGIAVWAFLISSASASSTPQIITYKNTKKSSCTVNSKVWNPNFCPEWPNFKKLSRNQSLIFSNLDPKVMRLKFINP